MTDRPSWGEYFIAYSVGIGMGISIGLPNAPTAHLDKDAGNLCDIYKSAATDIQQLAEEKNLGGDVEIRGSDGEVMCRIEHGVPLLIKQGQESPESNQLSAAPEAPQPGA